MTIEIKSKNLLLFFVIQIAFLAIVGFLFANLQTNNDLQLFEKIKELEQQNEQLQTELGNVGGGLIQIDSIKSVLQLQTALQATQLHLIEKTYQHNQAIRQEHLQLLEADIETAFKRLKQLQERAKQFSL